MRFIIVRADERRCECVDAEDLPEVLAQAGLKSGAVDFGTLAAPTEDRHGISIVVYEYGLFADPSEQRYFSIGRGLYAGNAVLFAFDKPGNTVDMIVTPVPEWYANGHEVEAAIRAGKIDRPVMAINDAVVWKWPERKPEDM